MMAQKSMPAAGPANLGSKKTIGGSAAAGSAAGNEQVKQLKGEMDELRINMDTVEKERDFYFGKLRDIEMLLQAMQEKDGEAASAKVMQILYASEEEKVEIDESGNLSITPIGGEAAAAKVDEEEEKLVE